VLDPRRVGHVLSARRSVREPVCLQHSTSTARLLSQPHDTGVQLTSDSLQQQQQQQHDVTRIQSYGRPHIGANWVSSPPWKMDEKLKSEKTAVF